MFNLLKILLVILCILGFSSIESRAEYNAWAPINPQFIGGSPLNGQWLLNKEQATNEYVSDISKKIEELTSRLLDRLDKLTNEITNNLDNLDLTLNFPVIMQVGSANTAVIGLGSGSSGYGLPLSSSRGLLSNFNPSWGME